MFPSNITLKQELSVTYDIMQPADEVLTTNTEEKVDEINKSNSNSTDNLDTIYSDSTIKQRKRRSNTKTKKDN